MKTDLYLIRHAETTANAEGLFAGITDCDLSNHGFKQAEDLALKLKNININSIYSSPLKRAVQTITPTAKLINKNINLVDDLREINLGEWENKSVTEISSKYPIESSYIFSTEHYIGIKGQEEMQDVANRMENAIREISINNLNNSVIIVSHYAAIKSFLCKINNIPFKDAKQKIEYIENASVRKLVYDYETDSFIEKLN